MSERLRLNRSLTHEAFPHACRPGELEFEVVKYSLDGQSAVEPETEGVVNLEEYQGWETASLTVRVDVDDDVLDAVFPESEEYPGAILVAGHCRATYLRDRTYLTEGPIEENTYTAEVKLNVDGVGGVVELHPYLLRGESRDPVDDYGVQAGVMLADGREWQVEVSDEDPGGDDDLAVDKASFEQKNADNPDSRFPPATEMYYLDLDKDESNPVLWFNSDHPEIMRLVEGDGESNYHQLTNVLVWKHVMSNVWSRMLTIAARKFDAEDSEWSPEWQAGVFNQAAGYLFPDEDLSPRKAAKRLQEEFEEGDHISPTKRIEEAVQEIIDPASGFANHVDRVGED